MLKNRIIPCLDVKNGRVVKGINFVELKDAGDPVEQAKIYSDGGADEICFLDITASNENRETIIDIVRKTAKELNISTDAKHRFERGIDPNSIIEGLEMATNLILNICGGEASKFTIEGKKYQKNKLTLL